MASKEMIERAAKAVKNEFSKVVGEFGLTRAKEIVPSNHRYIRAALDAARPAPAPAPRCVAVEDDGTAFDPYDLIRSQAAQIASLSAKVAEVERERDEARAYADLGCESADGGPHHVMTQGSYRFCGKCGITIRTPTLRERARKAEARTSELQREVERLRGKLNNAADTAYRMCAETRHVTLGDKLRAALQQEGE